MRQLPTVKFQEDDREDFCRKGAKIIHRDSVISQVKIHKPHRNRLLILSLIILLVLTSGCKKVGHSPFKAPKIRFITTENLHSVVTLGQEDVLIIGDYGTIYHSSDDGKNWEKQETGTENHLYHSSFIDNQNGWICGFLGTILHTSNGGKTWEQQESSTQRHLFSIHFIDRTHGWAVGDMRTVVATLDGGSTWAPIMKEADITYYSVCFPDPRKGWIVGEFGTILHTADGGKTWRSQDCKDIEPPDEGKWSMPKPSLYSVYFKDNEKGWISGIEGIILTTDDGGMNWKKILTKSEYSIFSLQLKGEKGWGVGAKGNYLVSLNRGKSWNYKVDVIKTRFWLQDLSFRDEKDGFVVGARGTVICTRNGGETWEMLSGISYEMPEFKMPEF
jgi:photosystem II stability/assembly factor-like uncharacterized protein